MEIVSLKLEKNMLDEIDRKLISNRYATRTEFMRDAIRHKLSELEKEELMRHVAKVKGISKRKTTDKQLHEAGEKVFEFLRSKNL